MSRDINLPAGARVTDTVIGGRTWCGVVLDIARHYDLPSRLTVEHAAAILATRTPWPARRDLPVIEAALHRYLADLEADR